MSDDTSEQTHPQKPVAAVPNWVMPPWVYALVILGGGGGATAVNIFGYNDSRDDDIARLEAQVAGVEKKVDDLAMLMTEIRISIAKYHGDKP